MPVKKTAPKKKATTTKTAVTKKVTPVKKTAAKKSVAKKPATKPAAKKTAAKVAKAKKPASKSTAVKKAAAKPETSKKAAVKKTTGKKAVAKKAPAKKAAPKATPKAATPKVTTPKSAPVKSTAVKPQTSKKEKAKLEKISIAVAPVNQILPERIKKVTLAEMIPDITPLEETIGDDYMNEEMKQHFRNVLNDWKKQLMEEVDRTVDHMKDEAANFPDLTDRATQEEEFNVELRTRDRERKLIKKIDETLQLIDDSDEYGYCDACGIEIGYNRLNARPTARLCIDCKTVDEIKEKTLTL